MTLGEITSFTVALTNITSQQHQFLPTKPNPTRDFTLVLMNAHSMSAAVLSILFKMQSMLSRLKNRISTNRQHTLTDVEISRSLGNLSVLPRELRDNIYAYIVPEGYTTKWHAVVHPGIHYTWLRHQEPGFEKPRYKSLKSPNAPKFNITIFLLSRIIHEEAMIVFYSLGTFRFAPPCFEFNGITSIGSFPSTNIANRIMNVELLYQMSLKKILILNSKGPRDLHSTILFWSPSPGPTALFKGNDIKRKSAFIQFKFFEWSSYKTEIIRTPILDDLKQLTGFRTVTLKLEKDSNNSYGDRAAWEKGRVELKSMLNEIRASLEPSLGHGAMSEPGVCWEFHSCQVVFHPRDHQVQMLKMRDTVTHEAEAVIGNIPRTLFQTYLRIRSLGAPRHSRPRDLVFSRAKC